MRCALNYHQVSSTMTEITEIKDAITQLPPQQLAELRKWFDEWEADEWDRQIEADIQAGRLDHLADKAIRSYEAGNCTEL